MEYKQLLVIYWVRYSIICQIKRLRRLQDHILLNKCEFWIKMDESLVYIKLSVTYIG